MSFNELKQRGSIDFPIELYRLNKSHESYEMIPHWHKECEIIHVLRGELSVKLNNNVYILLPGDTVFVNSETIHSAIPKDSEYECIVFSAESFISFSNNNLSLFPGFPLPSIVINEFLPCKYEGIRSAVRSLFESLYDLNNTPGKRFFVTAYIYNLYGEIIKSGLCSFYDRVNSLNNEKNVVTLKKVLQFIQKEYENKITLEDLSRVAQMSPKYFCAFFKEMTRQTPFEYINSYRTDAASKLLLSTDKSITDIAFSCGFNDLSYFIKTFKNYKGITPKAYRKH